MFGTFSKASASFQSSVILLSLCLVGWCGIIWSMGSMAHPLVQLMMPMSAAWTVQEATMVLVMWAVMMGAMMVPSALPMILAHQRMSRQAPVQRHAAFVLAYVTVWTGFSAVAAGLQWWLQELGILSRMLVMTHPSVAGFMLIGIGLFQFTPIKDTCLRVCRTPIGFLATEWRDGPGGAFLMGLQHGAVCVGCCWAMMLALFVFGAMNLTMIALLSTAVALEKLTPWGTQFSRLFGLIFLGLGFQILVF